MGRPIEVQPISKPETEARKEYEPARAQLRVLPYLGFNDVTPLSIVHAAFSAQLFEKNIRKLSTHPKVHRSVKEALRKHLTAFRTAFSTDRKLVLHELYGAGAQAAVPTLSSQEARTLIRDSLISSAQQLITMGPYHGYETLVLEQLHGVQSGIRVGSVVFDRHLDLLRARANHSAPLVECNSAAVFADALDRNLITAAAFIGVYPEYIELARTNPKTLPHAVAKQYAERILLTDTGHTRSLSDEQITAVCTQILSRFQAQGITHIIPSIDLDVCTGNDGVFATRYSPWSDYLALGVQDFPSSYDFSQYRLGSIDAPSETLARYAAAVFKQYEGEKKMELNPLEIPQLAAQMDIHPDGIRTIQTSTRPFLSRLPVPGCGMKVESVTRTVELLRHVRDTSFPNIELGVPLPGGGRYCGGVYEMFGPDTKEGPTLKAALAIAQSLSSCCANITTQ